MPAARPSPVHDEDIFAPTEKGTLELKASGTSLSVTELEVLVLVDGFSSVAELAARVHGIATEAVAAAMQGLAAAKLVVPIGGPGGDMMGSGFSTIPVPSGFFSGLSLDAGAEAEGGVSILKRKGYYVRIARRPAEAREAKAGWKPTILVIDDDPDLQKLIRTYFVMEGFLPRAAFKRDDIVVALRQQPAPDLVLLDVQLSDANGFDVLARMRQHPVLKRMPVVMLTAEATREAVLRGLQGGADGYVTKPFEPDMLVTAVKAVLGLSPPPEKKKA